MKTAIPITIEQFKKCVVWKKYGDTWNGIFSLDRSAGFAGISYTVAATPGQPARLAKQDIIYRLYDGVASFCKKYGYDFSTIVKQKLLAKTKGSK